MRMHIWDFIVRYSARSLRLTQSELKGLNDFMEIFIVPHTNFKYCRGKILVWTASILYFYGALHLPNRQPFELTLERITEVIDINHEHGYKDFQNVYTLLKEAYLSEQAKQMLNLD